MKILSRNIWLLCVLTTGAQLSACGGNNTDPENPSGSSSSGASSSSSSSSSSSASSSSSGGSVGGALPYRAITTEFSRFGVTTANSLYMDSDRFRAYYGGNGRNGGEGNLANVADRDVRLGLAHLEAAYECFVNEWGFRSPGLSINSDLGPYYKLNLYSTTTLNAGGAMGADGRAGLSFLELKDSAIREPGIVVHEFGHSLTYTEHDWIDQGRTGAWWETVANWFTDTYQTDPLCEQARERRGLPRAGDTIINLDANIALSYLPIVHTRNYYQAWPFLTYLTNNPDQYSGLGRMAVADLIRNHARNNETPLHVLERLVAPLSVQSVLGRYWARMAYLDIDHPKARQRFFNTRSNSGFKGRAFANLAALGNGRYRVKADRAPMYAGANITPLSISGDGNLSVTVTNTGNGQQDSDFTATLAIYDRASERVRYVELTDGAGTARIGSTEEVSLVVVNTPTTLYLFNAFESNSASPDQAGLNYEVRLSGAAPAIL